MAPHDKIIWFTHPDQLGRLEEISVPIIEDLQSSQLSLTGLSVIVRLSELQRQSIRYQYGVLFAIYQKITNFSSRIDPNFTAKLDLRVYFEHLCDLSTITTDKTIHFVTFDEVKIKKPNFIFHKIESQEADDDDCTTSLIFVPESPLLGTIPDEQIYESIAVGGTFDHLHSGHKLMLSLAALLSRERILCGITASEMLGSKTHPSKLEALDHRILTVEQFFKEFKLDCGMNLGIVTLRDPFGPTIELVELEALIVSPETLPGGLKSKLLFTFFTDGFLSFFVLFLRSKSN